MNLWTIPNLLTLLRFFTIPVFAYLVINRQIGFAFFVLFVASFSDWLDGFLARKLNQYSVFGEKFDPIVDRLYIITLVAVATIIKAVPILIVLLIVAREIYLAILMLRVRKLGYLGLPVHNAGKMGSFCLMGGLPLSLIATEYDLSNRFVETTAYAFIFWGIGLYIWSAYLYAQQFHSLRSSVEQKN
ncbi:MAG: CDP-alcohol phosphatidyltransferase family protein [Candidatus Nanopelagicales bacterium]